MTRRSAAVLLLTIVLPACGSPTAPTPTATTLSVTCPQAELFLGAAMTCTAMISQSNGPSRDVTTTAVWATDTPALVSVAGAQLSARTSGQAVMRASAEGHTATLQVRTYPNYAARPFPYNWTVTACTQNGSLAQGDICGGTPVGATGSAIALFSQAGSAVAAKIGGFGLPQTDVGPAVLALDGSMNLLLSGPVAATLTQDQRWRLTSPDGLTITGTVTLTWLDPQTGSTGQVDFAITPA